MKQGGGTGGNVDGGDDDEMQVVDGDRGGAGRKPGGGVGKDKAVGKDAELKIVGSEGQFVLMDCAHSRDTCVTFPFGGDDKAKACANCWCFVCEVPWKECNSWSAHCYACYADPKWHVERDDLRKRKKDVVVAAAGASERTGPAGVAGEAATVTIPNIAYDLSQLSVQCRDGGLLALQHHTLAKVYSYLYIP